VAEFEKTARITGAAPKRDPIRDPIRGIVRNKLMNQQRAWLYLTFYVIMSCTVIASLCAQPPLKPEEVVPSGEPGRISDWALAGVVWSDASLTKRLARQAAKGEEDQAVVEQLGRVVEQSEEVIQAMEEFGWRRVRAVRVTKPAVTEPVDPASPPQPLASVESAATPNVPTAGPLGVTETIEEEIDPRADLADVNNFRVEDFLADRPLVTEPIEEGVERGIAAGVRDPGFGLPPAGYLSRREVQTRSGSLPVIGDSIYDSDDYDPDVDYSINDPAAIAGIDVDPRMLPSKVDTPPAADVQTEPIKAARQESGDAVSSPVPLSPTALQRFTDQRKQVNRDAHWVQFQLDANQLRWNIVQADGMTEADLSQAIEQLKIHARMAFKASENPRLQSLLQTLVLKK